MNKMFLLIFALFLTSCTKDVILTEQEVDSKIMSFVETHFPGETIIQAVKDKDFLHKSYDVWLTNNIYLEFNRKHDVIEIGSEKQLPDSVVPAKILEFVKNKYPTLFITDWSLDDNRQEVELSNDLNLIFNKSGDFLRIED